MNVTNQKNFSMLIVAMTGRGKSTFLKSLLRKLHGCKNFIFDINKEHTEFYNQKFIPFKEFLKLAVTKENYNIVFEEATVYISNQQRNEDIRELLVRKRHTQNNIIFVYHSLSSIPLEILMLIDFMVLFRTNDRGDVVEKKFSENPKIFEAYKRVLNKTENAIVGTPNYYYKEIISL